MFGKKWTEFDSAIAGDRWTALGPPLTLVRTAAVGVLALADKALAALARSIDDGLGPDGKPPCTCGRDHVPTAKP